MYFSPEKFFFLCLKQPLMNCLIRRSIQQKEVSIPLNLSFIGEIYHCYTCSRPLTWVPFLLLSDRLFLSFICFSNCCSVRVFNVSPQPFAEPSGVWDHGSCCTTGAPGLHQYGGRGPRCLYWIKWKCCLQLVVVSWLDTTEIRHQVCTHQELVYMT